MYCEVYLFDAPYHIDRPFDYLCDDNLSVGSIVKVPFGKYNNLRLAVVTKTKDTSDGEGIKQVHSILDERYSLGQDMVALNSFESTWKYKLYAFCIGCTILYSTSVQGCNFSTFSPTLVP